MADRPFSLIVFLIDQSADGFFPYNENKDSFHRVIKYDDLRGSDLDLRIVGYSTNAAGHSESSSLVRFFREQGFGGLEGTVNDAFENVYEICSGWIDENWESRPPLVIHITTEATAQEMDKKDAASLMGLDTAHGSLSLVHCVLSESSDEILFPQKPSELPSGFLRVLFRKANRLSDPIVHYFRAEGLRVEPGAYGLLILNKSETLETFLSTLASPSQTKTGPSEENIRFDNNVQFSAYAPPVIRPNKRTQLIAFAHLDKLAPDADEDEIEPAEEVRQIAKQTLKKDFENYEVAKEQSRRPLPREGELTFALRIAGVECTPARQVVVWDGNVETVKFWIKAPQKLDGETCFGELDILYGVFLVGSIGLRILVSSTEEIGPRQTLGAEVYRNIFVSYAHDDAPIIQVVQSCIRSLGDQFLIDVQDLRSGQDWNEELMKMIRRADIFQLYWSNRSRVSRFVTQEWQYALSLVEQKIKHKEFVRPLYWESPLPPQPEDLKRLHFHYLGSDGSDVLSGRAELREEEHNERVLTNEKRSLPSPTKERQHRPLPDPKPPSEKSSLPDPKPPSKKSPPQAAKLKPKLPPKPSPPSPDDESEADDFALESPIVEEDSDIKLSDDSDIKLSANSGIELESLGEGDSLDADDALEMPALDEDSDIKLSDDSGNALESSHAGDALESPALDDDSEFELSMDSFESADSVMFDDEDAFESSATVVPKSGDADDFEDDLDVVDEIVSEDDELDDLDVFDDGADDFDDDFDAGTSSSPDFVAYSAAGPSPAQSEGGFGWSVTFGKIALFLLCAVVLLGGLVALVVMNAKDSDNAENPPANSTFLGKPPADKTLLVLRDW